VVLAVQVVAAHVPVAPVVPAAHAIRAARVALAGPAEEEEPE